MTSPRRTFQQLKDAATVLIEADKPREGGLSSRTYRLLKELDDEWGSPVEAAFAEDLMACLNRAKR